MFLFCKRDLVQKHPTGKQEKALCRVVEAFFFYLSNFFSPLPRFLFDFQPTRTLGHTKAPPTYIPSITGAANAAVSAGSCQQNCEMEAEDVFSVGLAHHGGWQQQMFFCKEPEVLAASWNSLM